MDEIYSLEEETAAAMVEEDNSLEPELSLTTKYLLFNKKQAPQFVMLVYFIFFIHIQNMSPL